jgi:predicted DNA-binding transcriptional regulator AlpA
MPEKIERRFIRDTELSEITGLSVQTFRNWRCSGKGPSYLKLDRTVLYDKAETLKYFEDRRVNPSGRG